jgi:two-component system OmpR family sensor kinase
LLDNACKYSQAGIAIKISIELQHESVMVRVWSSGKPIAPNERIKIFERFYRGITARQVAPGSGLGLYVARKIAQAHGGSLDLDSTDALDSDGTSFRLTIPIARNHPDPVSDRA